MIEGGKMNGEGYRDPTADKAILRSDKTPARVSEVVHTLRLIAGLMGFEIQGRIRLKDRSTGREYK